MHTRIISPTLLAIAGLGFAAAEEQALNVAEEQPASFDSVTIIGEAGTLFTLPGTAHRLDREFMRRDHSSDYNEILRQVPGVYVRPEDGYGLFPNISLRGTDNSRSAKISFMEDGLPAVPAPYSSPSAYYSPAIGRMDGLEVRKGSAQIRSGPHSTGGALNLLSVPIPNEPSGYTKSSLGTDQSLTTHTWVGGTQETSVGRIGALVDLYYAQTDGFKSIDSIDDPAYPATDGTGYSRFEPTLKLSWEPNSNIYQRIEGKFSYSTVDADQSYLGLSDDDFDDDPNRRYAASRFDNFTSELKKGDLRYTIIPNEIATITLTGYAQRFTRDWFKLKDLRDVDDGAGGGSYYSLGEAIEDEQGLEALRGERAGTLRYRHNDRRYTIYGGQVETDLAFVGQAVDHQVNLGVRLHYDSEYRLQQDIDYEQDDDGRIVDVRAVGELGTAGNRLQETTALALWAEDTATFGPWTVHGGLRLEHLQQEYEDRAPTTPASGEDDLTVWSGGLGASYQIDEAWVVFADVFRGVSTPAPRQAIRGEVTEESSIGGELGFRYRDLGGGDLFLESALFVTQYNDLLVVDNIGGAGTGDSENVGEVLALGFEAAAQVDPSSYTGWQLANPWRFTTTLTDARLVGDANSEDSESIFSGGKDGNRVPYIPAAVLSLRSDLIGSWWGTGIQVQYQSASYTTASNTSDAMRPDGTPDARFGETDALLLVNWDAWIQWSEQGKIFFGVNNVFDEQGVTTRHPSGSQANRPLYAFAGVEMSF